MSTTLLHGGLSFAVVCTLVPAFALAGPVPLFCDEHASPTVVRRAATPVSFAASAVAVVDDVPAPDGTTRPMRIEVRVENGKVSAELDGAKVSADRIVAEGGRITILGEDGRPIRAFPMVTVEPSGAIELVFETVDTLRRHADNLATWSMSLSDGETTARALREAAIAGAQARRYLGNLVDVQFSATGDRLVESSDDVITLAARVAPKVMIGVTLTEPDAALLRHLKLAEGEATMLTGIVEGLPAAKAGLEAFDIVVAVDGRSPSGPQVLRDALAERAPGDVLRLTVLRAGERREFDVTLAPFDPSRPGMAGLVERSAGDHRADSLAITGAQLASPGAADLRRAVPPRAPRTAVEGLPRILEVAPMPGGQRFLYQIELDDRGLQPPVRSTPGPTEGSSEVRLEKLEARLDALTRTLERLVEKLGG